jgi:hypothetical protein
MNFTLSKCNNYHIEKKIEQASKTSGSLAFSFHGQLAF